MGVLPCWHVVLSASFWLGHGGIYRHDYVDGEVREVSCSSLDDCFEKGFMTPGMMLHRMWARRIDLAMQKRKDWLSQANVSSLLVRQRQVRRALRRMLRAVDYRPSPATRLVRRYQDRSRGVTVLMLLFESWRGEFVPAVVFVPLGLETQLEKRPAVLHLPGHLAGGLRDPDEQKLSLKLAQQGYVVLSFDPISQGERLQYGPKAVDLECRAAKERRSDGKTPACKGEGPPCSVAHNHFGQQLWLLGHGAEELFLRDAQRALDILSELPFVNASSIGVVGCSGGGTMTAYLGAVDHRVTAAAVACYFSTLGRELEEGTCNYDAEQIIWGIAKHGIDKPDMLRARAPQATAVLLTSHDCFPIAGGREGFAEVEAAFRAHGNARNLYASEAAGFHEVTEMGLSAVQMFFEDQLGPRPDWLAPISDPSPFPCEMLWFGEDQLKTGISGPNIQIPQLLRSLARPKRQSLRWKRRGEAVGKGRRWLATLPQVSAHLAKVPAAAIEKVSLGGEEPTMVAARTQYYILGKEEWYILYTDSSCAVTLRLFESAQGRPKEDVVVLVFGGPTDVNRQLGEQEDLLLSQLQDHGFGAVVICGLCGFGDKFWRDGLWQFAPLLLGETHTGFHASEVLYTISWAFKQLRARQVVLVGYGGAVGAVLHAAVHAPSTKAHRLGALVLVGPHSFEEVAQAKRHKLPWQMQMHGVLNHYDLPDLLAAIPAKSTAPTLILEPRGASALLPRGYAWRMYWLAAKRLRRAGCSLRLLAGRRFNKLSRAFEIANFLTARVARA